MPKPNPEFAEAVAEALRRHNLTLRGAEYKTGIDHTTVTKMVNGLPPSRGKVIEWAEGLGEDINHWLKLADLEPIPAQLVREEGAGYEPGRPWRLQPVPEDVLQRIREAPTREQQIELAFDYIHGTGVLGYRRKGREDKELKPEELTFHDKELVVRTWQGITGQELLSEQ